MQWRGGVEPGSYVDYSSYRDMKNIGTCYLQLELGNISDKVKWGYLTQFWENCMIARAMESSIMINRFVSVKHNVIKLLTIWMLFSYFISCIFLGFPVVEVAPELGATLAQCLSGGINPLSEGTNRTRNNGVVRGTSGSHDFVCLWPHDRFGIYQSESRTVRVMINRLNLP